MSSNLASRGTRLIAILIDFLFLGSGYFLSRPLSYFFGGVLDWDHAFFALIVDAIQVIYFIFIFSIQLTNLHKRGQTIGKRVMKIKIVKMESGENGGIGTNFMMRTLIPFVIILVPYVGLAFGLIDGLFIFRDDYRCIHDLIAGTKVVKA